MKHTCQLSLPSLPRPQVSVEKWPRGEADPPDSPAPTAPPAKSRGQESVVDMASDGGPEERHVDPKSENGTRSGTPDPPRTNDPRPPSADPRDRPELTLEVGATPLEVLHVLEAVVVSSMESQTPKPARSETDPRSVSASVDPGVQREKNIGHATLEPEVAL